MAFRKGGSRGRRAQRPIKPEAHRINGRVLASEVLVVTDTGEKLGVIPTKEAISMAEERGLDLVEVSPNSDPPVCKFMDYGKFKYREQKKESEARKKRSDTTTKELRIRYRTDVGDLDTKLRRAREFLESGDKVKFSMRFRGREIMYVDLGLKKFGEITERLSDIASVDDQSPTSGRQIYIIYAPQK